MQEPGTFSGNSIRAAESRFNSNGMKVERASHGGLIVGSSQQASNRKSCDVVWTSCGAGTGTHQPDPLLEARPDGDCQQARSRQEHNLARASSQPIGWELFSSRDQADAPQTEGRHRTARLTRDHLRLASVRFRLVPHFRSILREGKITASSGVMLKSEDRSALAQTS